MEEPNPTPSSFNILKDSVKENNERIYSALREKIPEIQISDDDDSSDEDVEIVFSGIDHSAVFPNASKEAWEQPAAPAPSILKRDFLHASSESLDSTTSVGAARKEFKKQDEERKTALEPAKPTPQVASKPSAPPPANPTALKPPAPKPKPAPPQ
eukprot:6939046-Pyramimonas_sp.AAC.1